MQRVWVQNLKIATLAGVIALSLVLDLGHETRAACVGCDQPDLSHRLVPELVKHPDVVAQDDFQGKDT